MTTEIMPDVAYIENGHHGTHLIGFAFDYKPELHVVEKFYRSEPVEELLGQARDALKWEINCEDAITAIDKFLGDKSMGATK